MVRAWYMDNDLSEPRNEHHRSPPAYVPLEKLQEITGVEYFKLNPETFETDGVLEKIKKERGYTYEDQRILPDEKIPNLKEVLKTFYDEHLHTDEEIRLVAQGSGYFDVRDKNDEWIRIEVVAGDLLILPGGIYHRFTLDNKNFICAKRYFIGEPVWTAYNRPCDEMDVRKEYLHKLNTGKSI